MAYIIKALLATTETQYYKNTQDRNTTELLCTNMTVCNTSSSPVDVSLSFYEVVNQAFETGAVLFETSIPANESIEIQNRILYQDDIISAKASVADVASLSIDIIGVTGRYLPPTP